VLYNFHIIKLIPAAIALILLCASYANCSDTVLKIGGTGSALGSINLIAAFFEASQPDIKVKIYPSMSSSGGIKAVSEGSIDIGLSGRLLNVEEQKMGLSVFKYALSPFIPVAHTDVVISSLTTDEVINIYRGEKLAWPDGKRIRLILRPSHDSDTQIIRGISPEMGRAVDVAFSREGMLTAVTDQENADIIEKTPGTLGFCTLTQAITELRKLKILSYNGIPPSVNTLSSGRYPLSKPHFIVTRPEPAAAVRRFIEFLTSAEGKKIMEEAGNLIVVDTSGK